MSEETNNTLSSIEERRHRYPTGSDLLTLLGVFIVASVGASLLTGILVKVGSITPGFGIFLGYLIQFSVVIAFGLYQRKIRSPKGTVLLRFGFKIPDFMLILWGVILVMATGLVIEPILALFPGEYMDRLNGMMGEGGWMMFTSVLIAPILEEVFFRGIVQDSLTSKYGAVRGILLASAVFGIVHLIPQQVVNAFMVGLVLGYIYYRTRSLVPVMIIHCINNGVSYFSWVLGGEKIRSMRELLQNDTLYYTVYTIACILFVIGFVAIGMRLGRAAKGVEPPSPKTE